MDTSHRTTPSPRVFLDGRPLPAGEAAISVFDMGLQRGYGCFEALRAYGGVPFRLAQHLDRLAASAAALAIGLPPRADMEEWISIVAAEGGDCIVRILITSGSFRYEVAAEPASIVFSEPAPVDPGPIRIMPLGAPWHGAGEPWPLAGAKTLSYAPNLASALVAQRSGYDDALLVSRDGIVLEGTHYGVGWFVDGAFETPSLDTGILASITRAAVLEVLARLDVPVREVEVPLARIHAADEVCALSTVREVTAVVAIGDREFPEGERTRRLAEGFADLARSETAPA